MVVWNVTRNILPPDDWVIIICPEESCNVCSPCFKRLESFLAKDTQQVPLDSGDSISGNVVTKNTE